MLRSTVPRSARSRAEQHLCEFGAARAHQSVDAENFSAAQGKADVLEFSGAAQVLDAQHWLADARGLLRKQLLDGPAHHEPDELVAVGRGRAHLRPRSCHRETPRSDPPVRRSRRIDGVMNSSAHPASRSWRAIRNNSAHSRRDNDAVGSSRISTRDSLTRARAICTTCFCAMLRAPAGVPAVKSAPSSCSTAAARACIARQSMSAPRRGCALMNRFSATLRWSNTRHSWCTTPMPRSRAAAGVAIRVAAPSISMCAGVRLVNAGEDFHQRGLARAVLADQRGHRAAMQFQVHAGKRAHAAEGLAHVGEPEEGRRHVGGSASPQKIFANSATLVAS